MKKTLLSALLCLLAFVTTVSAQRVESSQLVTPKWFGTDTGTANAYAVCPVIPLVTPFQKGTEVRFTALHANTGASTLSICGGTATALTTDGSTVLSNNAIAAGEFVIADYDGTEWQAITSASGSSSAGAFGSLVSPTANGTYTVAFQVNAGVGVSPTAVLPGILPTVQTGTTYLYAWSDRGQLTEFSSASGTAVSLPQAGSTGFTSNWVNLSCNIGVGNTVITPATSTFNIISGNTFSTGQPNLALSTGQCVTLYSDNTNYTAIVRGGNSGSGSGLPAVPSSPAGVVYGISAFAGGTAAWEPAGMGLRSFTAGTTDNIYATDRALFITYNEGSTNISVTVPDAGTAGFTNNFTTIPIQMGTGVITLNRTSTSTINGATSQTIYGKSTCTLNSPDNANWLLRCIPLLDNSGDLYVAGGLNVAGLVKGEEIGVSSLGMLVPVTSWADAGPDLESITPGTDACAIIQTYTQNNPYTFVYATAAPIKASCNSQMAVPISAGGVFTGILRLGPTLFYIYTSAGLQSFGSGMEVDGMGRTSGTWCSAGSGTCFNLCGPLTPGYPSSGDYLTYCHLQSYIPTLSNDGMNYPPVIAASNYPPTDGTAHNTTGPSSTAFGTRIFNIDVGVDWIADATCFANYQSQEQSLFNDIRCHNVTGINDIGFDVGGAYETGQSDGGSQNSWWTDFQISSASVTGCANSSTAVGIRIATYGSSNGNPTMIEKGSIVNNCTVGTLPNRAVEYTSGATDTHTLIEGMHIENYVNGISEGVATIKGVETGEPANGLQVIDVDVASSGLVNGFVILNNAGLSGAAAYNTILENVAAVNSGITNIILDQNNIAITQAAHPWVERYSTNATGQTVFDTTGTNPQHLGLTSAQYGTQSSAATGNVGPITMLTPLMNSDYEFGWTVSLTAPGVACTGSTTVVLNVIFTDPNTSTATTLPLQTITLATGVGTAGYVASGLANVWAKAATNVQYSTTSYTAGSGCTTNPTYQITPRLVYR